MRRRLYLQVHQLNLCTRQHAHVQSCVCVQNTNDLVTESLLYLKT